MPHSTGVRPPHSQDTGARRGWKVAKGPVAPTPTQDGAWPGYGIPASGPWPRVVGPGALESASLGASRAVSEPSVPIGW